MKIYRYIYDRLIDHLDSKEISMIVGPRQAGKTTVMKALREFLINKGENTLFLNLDIETDKQYFQSQATLLKKINLDLGTDRGYVFIDEIQRKENAGLFLKGLYDQELPYKFIVSGSGSLELKEKLHESLVGRKRLFELDPVSYEEFVNYKTNYRYKDRLLDFFRVETEQSRLLLDEYMSFGGYPRIVCEDREEEKRFQIDEIYRSYIEKDIVYLLKLERMDAFNNLIKLLSGLAGRLINYSSLATLTGLSLPTLKKYLWYTGKTFIIHTITPFHTNRVKEITKSQVVYFKDLGFRNYAAGGFGMINQMNQAGFLFQNFIANFLETCIMYSGWQLHFWRTTDKSEVDFIIRLGDRTLLPVEIKYTDRKDPKVKRSLRSFIERYNPPAALVVNLGFSDTMKIGQTAIHFLPYYELLDRSRIRQFLDNGDS